MVMKVGNINPVLFKNVQTFTQKQEIVNNNPQITELGSITPDFAVKTPQKYTAMETLKTENGLLIYPYKLANGQRVTIIPMEDSPTTVKNYVNVGSMNETDNIKGISHFLEHMAFNGTNGSEGYLKLNQGDSFKKIEQLGGWTNASTNYALTDYVNSTPLLDKSDLERQLQVIASMSDDLTLADNMITKEKGPVCSEINMILDNPQTIAMDETVRSLFNIRSSADELVGGSVKHIQNLTQDDIKNYYNKYYTPDNMNLVITGNINPQETIEMVSKLFLSNKTSNGKHFETTLTPIKTTVRKDFITDKASSANILFGFTGLKNNDTKSKIIFEILNNYLLSSKTNLNKELKRLNSTHPAFGIEKVSTNPNNPTMIYYGIECSEEKSEEALKVIFDIISNLKEPTQKELNNIKEKLLQNHDNELEYSVHVNSMVGNAIFNNNLDYLTNYKDIVNDITINDVKEFITKHLDLNKAALSVVHPETTPEAIEINHKKASKLTFKGNNYKIGVQETKNTNSYFDINLYFNMPDKNPAAKSVLSSIYQQNLESDNYLKFAEENNLDIDIDLTKDNLSISGYSGKNNFEKTLKAAKELLNKPAITQEYFEIAINRIKENIARSQDTASGIYANYEATINPLYTSKQDILDGLNKITLEDVKELHQYILNNSSGTISTNNKEIDKFEILDNVQNHNFELRNVYVPNEKTIVLTKDRAVSQADIMQTFKYEWNNSPKERAISEIMNTILSSSQSIGLFNTLREKEHLAYTVYSNNDWVGNCGELSLNILTTTDNKEIGEITYDNVQKSINGFNRQIGELLGSKYTDEDLESAKRILKANLLQKEGVWTKLSSLNRSLKYSRDFDTQVFNEIDKITREDIDSFAKKVFTNPPTYSIVASKDTLEANRDFLDTLAL